MCSRFSGQMQRQCYAVRCCCELHRFGRRNLLRLQLPVVDVWLGRREFALQLPPLRLSRPGLQQKHMCCINFHWSLHFSTARNRYFVCSCRMWIIFSGFSQLFVVLQWQSSCGDLFLWVGFIHHSSNSKCHLFDCRQSNSFPSSFFQRHFQSVYDRLICFCLLFEHSSAAIRSFCPVIMSDLQSPFVL